MNKYEIMYVIAGEVSEDEREKTIAKFEAVVVKNEGVVDSVDKMGMKKFAYPIKFKNEGFYVLMHFTAKPEIIAEIERRMRITDKIVRYITIRKDV